MEDSAKYPVLLCCNKLKPEFDVLKEIPITSNDFSLGRGLKNSIVIPYITISRSHCTFKMNNDHSWSIEDHSSFGIKINGNLLGKGVSKTLSNGDILTLDQTSEFVYKFAHLNEDECEIPRKRKRIEDTDLANNTILNDMRIKFEASQTHEIEHIEQKLKNVKQMQSTSKILKKHLHAEMDNKIKQLQNEYTSQIENLRGEKNEIEMQKAILVQERDEQLALIKFQMEEKILELTEQVQKHNEKETELLTENSLLKEKLQKERQEFIAEISRENSSKQDMLAKLEARIKEQEEVRMKERQESLELLHREMEKLKEAKEIQIKKIEEQKKQRITELKKELDSVIDNLQDRVLQSEQEKLKTERLLNEQMERMKKLSDEEKMKIEVLMKEREEIQMKLAEAQTSAAKTLEELSTRVSERETELAALAAERIQQQAEQSSEVISTLQQQLENVKKQLVAVESEKNTMLENMCALGEGTSRQSVLTELGDVVESELQCSICAELFVTPVTLNCSHTFCQYCITMWKKKKMDCPICRSSIITECKSLVLDTFIDKMVQSLSDEMKQKRKDILKSREAEVAALSIPTSSSTNPTTRRRSSSRRRRNTSMISNTLPTNTHFLMPIPFLDRIDHPTIYRPEPLNLTTDSYYPELRAVEGLRVLEGDLGRFLGETSDRSGMENEIPTISLIESPLPLSSRQYRDYVDRHGPR